jgi:DNA excision repair protein ERCC-4
MNAILVAPSEPPLIKTLGTVALVPEAYGCDIMWAEPVLGGLVCVQRKEVSDLVKSVGDGRLAKECQQLLALTVKLAVLVVEGQPHFSNEGVLLSQYQYWTRAQHRSLLRSVQLQGILVDTTDSTADTVAYIGELAHWAAKEGHHSLERRPKPKGEPTDWGVVTDRRWGMHLLQSVPGIGPGVAADIWDHCGGLPVKLAMSADELRQIKGVGPKTVKALARAFGN